MRTLKLCKHCATGDVSRLRLVIVLLYFIVEAFQSCFLLWLEKRYLLCLVVFTIIADSVCIVRDRDTGVRL